MKLQINGEIGWDVFSQDVKNYLEGSSGDVIVEINSRGGDVFEGIEIYNALKEYSRGNITVQIGAICASIASYISQAGDEIKAYDNSVFMIHNAWTFALGDHRDLRKMADICENLSNIIAKSYLRANKDLNEIKNLMNKESYFYGVELKEYGFCDEVATTEEEKNKDEAYALAIPKIKATLDKTKEKYKTEEIMKFAAKLISTNVEKTEPKVDTEVSNESTLLTNVREREINLLKEDL